MRKSVSRLRAELSQKFGHDFQNAFAALLGEVMEGTALTKKLGRLDRAGIDAFILSEDESAIETVIQCKGFELPEYGPDQHRQSRDEIAKFLSKGPAASEYWLVINRPIKDRVMRDELVSDLSELVAAGKVKRIELLDSEPAISKLRNLATARLIAWAEAKREQLFEYYASRLQFVQYIREVPFNGPGQQRDPAGYGCAYLREFFDGLPAHQTGRYRRAPRLLVTSEFGFGKTSTLQAIAREWIKTGGHAIYAPAALLNEVAFQNTAGLADSLLDLLVPDDAEISDLGHHVFRDTLRGALTISKNWIVIIDGLDENPAAFNPNSLAALWGSISDLGVPAILSARDELVENRLTEFFPNPALRVAPVFERISLRDWSDDLILEFVRRFRAAQGGDEPAGFREFRELVEAKRYEEVYGDIPERPLFLGMLAQDAWSGDEPARQLHRLYGRYFRQKLFLDRRSMSAGGAARRPSAIVDAFGLDEAAERLIGVMQDVAEKMAPAEASGAAQHDTIGEGELRKAAKSNGIEAMQVEDIVMHSLLQPAGRHPITRERLIRFAHRSFQDWFLARYHAARQQAASKLPATAARFLDAMLADLAAGGSLP